TWVSSKRLLWFATVAIWLSFVAFTLSGGTRVDGTQRPTDWYGWPNRAFIVAFCAWMTIVAWNAIKMNQLKLQART
ncbi:MAG TPA: hypothetical protein VF510_10885, partial [Ktedonobacterales bacterium]